MIVLKKKYEELEHINKKIEEDFKNLINEMREEAEKEREYLINETIDLDVLFQLNEELEMRDYCILGIEKNELGDVIAVISTRGDKAGEILLYSLKENKYDFYGKYPKVLVSERILNKKLKIKDIQSMEENQNSGNGTILLKYLEKEAKRCGYSCITGELAKSEPKAMSKLVNFYEKNGYEVILTKSETVAKVKLSL